MSDKVLDDLPESGDKEFWGDAEVHTNILPHKETSEDGHYFEHINAVMAECKHCHWGFQLDPGDTIRDGHLYDRRGKRVI